MYNGLADPESTVGRLKDTIHSLNKYVTDAVLDRASHIWVATGVDGNALDGDFADHFQALVLFGETDRICSNIETKGFMVPNEDGYPRHPQPTSISMAGFSAVKVFEVTGYDLPVRACAPNFDESVGPVSKIFNQDGKIVWR
ncbi:MAG: hypothetical protein Q3972_07440 [Corynebacterium sp.]|nr:hypothetical protein [Corynebacterium sp.]